MMIKSILVLLLIYSTAVKAISRPIVIVGDSLSAAYGIEIETGWVNLLQQRLADRGYTHEVINASISGDTTAGGLTRLPEVIQRYEPGIVVIELGGNDGLRGLALSQTRDNLAQMIQLVRSSGAKALLLGMMMPPNFGKRFTEKFLQMYHDIAAEEEVPLVPFFLSGVAENSSRMQEDRIHPNALGQSVMLDNVWPVLVPLLGHSPRSLRREIR